MTATTETTFTPATARHAILSRRLRLAAVITAALLGIGAILWGAGILKLTSYNGTYGVTVSISSHYYLFADVTAGTDFNFNMGGQHTGF